jgi:hypothetical protein
MAASDAEADGEANPGDCVLELYLAGDSVTSRRALSNLEAIIAHLDPRPKVTVVDVLGNPKAAFEKRVFATPSLVSTNGDRSILILGDLSDRAVVLERLGRPLR